MGYDGKYGKVTTEYGDIGEDEPVIVFRAQDGVLPDLLLEYHRICEAYGSPERHLTLIERTREQILKWQANPANNVRRPPTSEGPAGLNAYERFMRDANPGDDK